MALVGVGLLHFTNSYARYRTVPVCAVVVVIPEPVLDFIIRASPKSQSWPTPLLLISTLNCSSWPAFGLHTEVVVPSLGPRERRKGPMNVDIEALS